MAVLYVDLKSTVKKEQYQPLLVRDVAQLFMEGFDTQPLLATRLGRVRPGWNALSPVQVVTALYNTAPKGTRIQMVGEQKCMVQGVRAGVKTRPLAWLGAVFIGVLLFCGGALSLMNFHADVNMPDVHANLSRMITGDENGNSLWLSISYSVGIAVGVVFFTGFGKKRSNPNFFELEEFEYRDKVEKYRQGNETGESKNG